MPRLTVRAFAELMALPLYEQVRILQEQKYPKQQPQLFKVPYYAPALNGIRDFYRVGNDFSAFSVARAKIAAVKLDSKRKNNFRVLDQFENSSQVTRPLLVRPSISREALLSKTQLGLKFDLVAEEKGKPRLIFYNCRIAIIEPDIARTTLELAQWVLEQRGGSVDLNRLQLIDLASGKVYAHGSRRPTTMKRAVQNAKVIEAIWPTI